MRDSTVDINGRIFNLDVNSRENSQTNFILEVNVEGDRTHDLHEYKKVLSSVGTRSDLTKDVVANAVEEWEEQYGETVTDFAILEESIARVGRVQTN